MSDQAAITPLLPGVIVQSPTAESTYPRNDVVMGPEQGRSRTTFGETRRDEDASRIKMKEQSLPLPLGAEGSDSSTSRIGSQPGFDDQAHSFVGAGISPTSTMMDPGLSGVPTKSTDIASTPDTKVASASSVRRKPVSVHRSTGSISQAQYSDLPEVVPSESIQSPSAQLPEAMPGTNLSRLVSDLPEVGKPTLGAQSGRLQDVTRGPPAKSKIREASTTSQTGTTTSDDPTLASREMVIYDPTSTSREMVRYEPQPITDHKVPQGTEQHSMTVVQDGDVPPIDRPDREGYPLLVRAARDDQIEVVRTLLMNGANVEARHAITGRTALMEASLRGQIGIVELLAQYGCLYDSPDIDSSTALHLTAANGDVSLTKYLIDQGAAVNIKGKNDETPLHTALRHPDIINLLLHRRADLHARNTAQRTPLHMSAATGLAVACDVLINLYGAQLDARDSESKTPLQLAVDAGHIEIVKMLLARMNLKPKDPVFMAALFAAIETGNAKMVEAFFDRGASLKSLGDNSFKPAVLTGKSGSPAMLELMISKKCKLKEKDKNDWSALHYAAQYGHTHMIERLLHKDLSIKAVTKTKETPLILAVKGGHFAATDVLLRGKGAAQVKTQDTREQYPLHHAVRIGDMGITKLLLSNKADINPENAFGWRPIHLAIAYGHTAIVGLLLDSGANSEEKLGKSSVNRKETHSMIVSGMWAEARWPYPDSRPLHLAIEYGRNDIAELLLSKGVKTESTCAENWRPLHHAAFGGNIPMIEQLLERNANVHAVTSEGKTALQLAQFRITTGLEASQRADYARVQFLLNTVMVTAKRQTKDQWKSMVAFNGKKAQDKYEAIKAAAVADEVVNRQRTLTR